MLRRKVKPIKPIYKPKRENPTKIELDDLIYSLVHIDYHYGQAFGTLEKIGIDSYTIMELDKISKHISFVFYTKDVVKITLFKNKQRGSDVTKAQIDLE